MGRGFVARRNFDAQLEANVLIAVFDTQRASYAVSAASRSAARAYLMAADPASAEQRARVAARVALRASSNISGLLPASQLGVTLSSLALGWVAVAAVGAAFAGSVLTFFDIVSRHHDERSVIVTAYDWIVTGDFGVSIDFLLDPLSATMLLVVTGVGLLIHIYSIGYMHGDERFPRFFAYLNLFMASMLILVLASIAMPFVNKAWRGDYLNWSTDFKGGTEIILGFREKGTDTPAEVTMRSPAVAISSFSRSAAGVSGSRRPVSRHCSSAACTSPLAKRAKPRCRRGSSGGRSRLHLSSVSRPRAGSTARSRTATIGLGARNGSSTTPARS